MSQNLNDSFVAEMRDVWVRGFTEGVISVRDAFAKYDGVMFSTKEFVFIIDEMIDSIPERLQGQPDVN